MKKIFNLLLFVPFLSLTGCSGPSKLMNGWVGKTKEQLYKTWGQPERTVDNGKDGIILIYSAKADLYEAPGMYYSNEGDGYNRVERPPQKTVQYTKLKLFYINPSGVITSWKMEDI